MTKYIIGKPIINKGEITGYEVIDTNGNIRKVRLNDVFQLIEKGITNCEIVLDNNNIKHILFVNGKPDTTDDTLDSTIECRIIQNNSLVGYKCKDSTGASKRINPTKVWELAACGHITNAKAKTTNNQITLVGNGVHLRDLVVLNV